MKTEREIYLKPLTLREQVAMEQGICVASVVHDARKSGATTIAHDYEEVKKETVEEWNKVEWI